VTLSRRCVASCAGRAAKVIVHTILVVLQDKSFEVCESAVKCFMIG
jgi:hypothetical protein